MVAGLERVAQRADSVGGGVAAEDRTADLALRAVPLEAVELVAQLGRHPARELLATRGEDVGGEAARVLDGGERVRGLVDADEREGRLDGDGAESADGETARAAVLAECRQNHDAAWE